MSVFSYNLVDEPWIPCVLLSGEPISMGFKELFLRAHELRGFDIENPLAEASLIRVILAVAHRVVDGPREDKEWRALYLAGSFPQEQVEAYFAKWRHRFDLFSPEVPFYQTPGLKILDGEGRESPVAVHSLMLDKACGSAKTLFDHTLDALFPAFTPAEAAFILITAQTSSFGKLNKKTTNHFGYQQSFLQGVLVGGIFALLEGNDLFHTLVFNLLICEENEPIPSTDSDRPVWERNDYQAVGAVDPKGYLDYLSCRCRHILLLPEDGPAGPVVRHAHIAQGEAFPGVDNPSFFLRQGKDGSLYPVQLSPDRLLWRDSGALYALEQKSGTGQIRRQRPKAFMQAGMPQLKKMVALPEKLRCTVYGLANDQANPLAWRKESLNIPTDLLSDGKVVGWLMDGLQFSEFAGMVLNDAVATYIRECLPENSKDVKDKAKATEAGPFYYDRLDGRFRIFLENVDQGENALETWKETVKKTAREAFETCLKHRYADSAKSLKAWTKASGRLNGRLKAGPKDKDHEQKGGKK